MKKSIYWVISLSILWGNPNIYAQAAEAKVVAQIPAQSFIDQWRIGFGIAGEYLYLEAKMKDDFSPFGKIFQSDRSQTKKKFQVAPSIEVGATFANDFYLGIFFSWRYSDAKTKSRAPLKNLTHFFHEFKMNYYFDILAKPGYKLTPNTMVYGLIGPSIARWSHITDQFQQQTMNDRFKITRTSVGFSFGGGLEHVIKENWALSIDYIYHIHKFTSKKQKMTFFDNTGEGLFPRTGVVSKEIQPSYSTIGARVSYFF